MTMTLVLPAPHSPAPQMSVHASLAVRPRPTLTQHCQVQPSAVETPRRLIVVQAVDRDNCQFRAVASMRRPVSEKVHLVTANFDCGDLAARTFLADSLLDEVAAARTHNETVYVHVRGDEQFALALGQMSDMLEIRMVSSSKLSVHMKQLLTSIAEVGGDAPDKSPRSKSPLRVGVDASKGARKRGAGVGVVTGNGTAWLHYLPKATSIHEAELEGIAYVTSTLTGRPLIIECDSRSAVSLANVALADPRRLQQFQGLSRRKRSALDEIVRQAQHRKIEVRWVKGHADNSLNLAADRLAVLARRRFQDLNIHGGSVDLTRSIAEDIVRELVGQVKTVRLSIPLAAGLGG